MAEKNSIGYTLVSDDTGDDLVSVLEEQELPTPGAHHDRGAQLTWLLAEARDMIARLTPDKILMQKPGLGFSRERVEVEALIRVAAADAGVPLELVVNDGVRARLGVPKAAKSFDRMLAEPDVAARSNKARRERYLFAKAALSR